MVGLNFYICDGFKMASLWCEKYKLEKIDMLDGNSVPAGFSLPVFLRKSRRILS